MKALQLLILLSISVLSFTTCKKYPQDGKLSFETPDKRLRRVWTLTECLVDGDDITDKKYTLIYFPIDFNDTVIYTLRGSTLEFQYSKNKINGKTEKVYSSLFAVRNIIKHLAYIPESNSRYTFENHKRSIAFNSNDNHLVNESLLFNFSNEDWAIKKLVKSEFIIETTNSTGNKIKVTFKGQ